MDVVNVTADAESFTCNAYLAHEGSPTLVDAGAMPGVADEIRKYTDSLDRVVLTHQHGDHVERLDEVLDAFDADLYAYADHPRRTHDLADGDEVTVGTETCEVVYTPGHADDHVSLVSDASLFSGDVVVHDDGAFDDGSFGRTDYPGQSRERLIESIRELLARMPEGGRASDASTASGDERSESAGVEHMYSGHGGVFHGDGRESDDSRARRTGSQSAGVRDVVETALERAEKREPKYPDE